MRVTLQIGQLPPPATLHVSKLPAEISAPEVNAYFEGCADDVEVNSILLGGGRAKVEIFGLSDEEKERLQSKKHKIKRQEVVVEFKDIQIHSDPHTYTEPEPPDSTELFSPVKPVEQVLPDVLEVSDIPAQADESMVVKYFEKPKSGGSRGAVKEYKQIGPGVAHITFCSSEVAATIFEKSDHALARKPIKLRQIGVDEEDPAMKDFLKNKLLVLNIPEVADEDFLQLLFEESTEKTFSLKMLKENHALIIIFDEEMTHKELSEVIAEIEDADCKGAKLKAERCKITKSVRLRGATKHYDDEFIRLYFGNQKRSGGGEVESVDLLGSGEAVITFADAKVIDRVIGKKHEMFGIDATVAANDTFQFPENNEGASQSTSATPTKPPMQPLQLKVDPLIAKLINKNPERLNKAIKDWHVQVGVDTTKAIIEVCPTKQTKAGWQEVCNKVIEGMYVVRGDMHTSSEARADIIQALGSHPSVEYEFTEDKGTCRIAGDSKTVSELQGIIAEIEKVCLPTNTSLNLSSDNYTFLYEMRQSVISKNHPKVKITFKSSDNSLTLQGPQREVEQLKQRISEYASHAVVHVELQPPIVQYLNNRGRTQLNNFLQGKNIAAYFVQISKEQIYTSLCFLCDPNAEQATKITANALQKAVSLTVLPFPETIQLQEMQDYKELCHQLEDKDNLQIETTVNQVIIIGFLPGFTQGKQKMDIFINKKRFIETSISISKPEVWKLFCGPMRESWRSVTQFAKQNEVDMVCPPEASSNPKVVLKGDQVANDQVSQMINDLLASVECRVIEVSRPGTCKYFLEEQSQLILTGLENKYNVYIKIEKQTGAREQTHVSVSHTPTHTKVCKAQTKELKNITVYVGDIAEFDRADVIVNAANEHLKHIDGVAKAIADKGGPIIQQDCQRHIDRKGSLYMGDIYFTTTVGDLPCKALIHAVGPRWSGSQSHEAAYYLEKVCKKSLDEAKGYHSIAFPAISSGIFQFPIDRCADILTQSVVKFSKKESQSELEDIYFVVFTQQHANAFVKSLKHHLPAHFVVDSSSLQHSASPITPPVSQPSTKPKKKEKKKEKKKKQAASAAADVSSSTVHECIKLKKGSLLDVKADVYVNTTNCDLDLSQGAVAQALSKAAGPELQKECTKKAPVSMGSVTVTRAGKLQAKFIFHTVCSQYDKAGGQAETVLRNIIQQCLKEATKRGLTSIAFPALGAGNLSFPSDVVANIMVNEIINYLTATPKSSLTVVHLVIFMSNTHRAFQSELSRLSIGQRELSVSTHKAPVSPLLARPTLWQFDSPLPTKESFPFQDATVLIMKGDITVEDADAIVSTTNKTMNLYGPGVSGALLRKGGQGLQTYCNAMTAQGIQLDEGKLIFAPAAGTLKCKQIFFINLESKDSKKLIKIITQCLTKAEECQYQSIAFPAIGAGQKAMYTPEEVAKGMLRAIHDFALTNPTHVHSIRIVLYKDDAYQTFITTFKKKEDILSQSGGVWQKIWEGVGSVGLLVPSWLSSGGYDEATAHTNSDYEDLMDSELEIMIYGKTIQVNEAEKQLKKLINDHLISDTHCDQSVDDLTPEDESQLKALGRRMCVEIEIDREPMNIVRFKGDKTDVQQMKVKVMEVLDTCKQQASRKAVVQQGKQLVQWKRVDSQEDSESYDSGDNYDIEQAYQRHDKHFRKKCESDNYTIDFNQMKEKDHDTGSICKVVRVDYRETAKPSYWDPMPADSREPCFLVTLSTSSKEYEETKKAFDTTMQGDYKDIIKIQRVQNPMLYTQYIITKKTMDKQNPDGHKNERKLFHGTSADTCSKINDTGFNRSFAGKNATVYGKGVYFARDASYSAGYSGADQSSDYKYMYVARVLTGEYTVGNSSMIVPPPKDPKYPNILYDSVVNTVSDPTIFVIFYDSRAYPEYLIVFQ